MQPVGEKYKLIIGHRRKEIDKREQSNHSTWNMLVLLVGAATHSVLKQVTEFEDMTKFDDIIPTVVTKYRNPSRCQSSDREDCQYFRKLSAT